VLATDGCFYKDAAFTGCPPPDTSELEKLFRAEVFNMLKSEVKINVDNTPPSVIRLGIGPV
jgi:hypothetical protein